MMRIVYGQALERGEVNIACEHCGNEWVEQVEIDPSTGDQTLPLNEGWFCPECKMAFCFDDFAGDVKPLR